MTTVLPSFRRFRTIPCPCFVGFPIPEKELTDDYNPLEAGLWHSVHFDKVGADERTFWVSSFLLGISRPRIVQYGRDTRYGMKKVPRVFWCRPSRLPSNHVNPTIFRPQSLGLITSVSPNVRFLELSLRRVTADLFPVCHSLLIYTRFPGERCRAAILDKRPSHALTPTRL